jgi:hypothetical protein
MGQLPDAPNRKAHVFVEPKAGHAARETGITTDQARWRPGHGQEAT